MSNIIDNNNILEPLNANQVHKYLVAQGILDIKVLDVLESISSTNDFLMQEQFKQVSDITICIAEQQTHGRGRFGHAWTSPAGVNLYFSMLWPLAQWQKKYETLSLWCLITIAELLEQLNFESIQLKWPNDICSRDKKLGGILIERKSKQLIIGVGLNVAMSVIDDVKIDNPWIDLLCIKPGWDTSRSMLLANVIAMLYAMLTKLEKDNLQDLASKWRRYDAMLDRLVKFKYQGKRIKGIAQGIDEHGRIKMQIDKQINILHSSQISEIKI